MNSFRILIYINRTIDRMTGHGFYRFNRTRLNTGCFRAVIAGMPPEEPLNFTIILFFVKLDQVPGMHGQIGRILIAAACSKKRCLLSRKLIPLLAGHLTGAAGNA